MELTGRVVVLVAVVASVSVLVGADAQAERRLDNGAGVWNWVRSVAPGDGGAEWPKLEVTARVIGAAVLSSIGACICAAGGIGGGGLFIPIFNLLLLFDAKTSAALSNIMILGGSLAVLAWNIQQTHPLSPTQPLIDYDVALLLNPNMLLGISVGVFCNIMFPGWLLISVLTVILLYMTNRSVKSGFSRWNKESAAAAKARAKLAAASDDAAENGTDSSAFVSLSGAKSRECGVLEGFWFSNIPATRERPAKLQAPQLHLSSSSSSSGSQPPNIPHGWAPSMPPTSLIGANVLTEPLLTPHPKPSWSTQCPPQKLTTLALVWLLFFAVQILRGGEGTEGILKVEPCGLAYWLMSCSQVPLALGLTAWIAFQHSSKSHAVTASESEEQEEVDVLAGAGAYTLFPTMAFLAGMLGGMLGIGGGMIINPMLIEVGMHPQVTAATSSFMIFFASSMSVLQFWLLGRIPMDFAALFGALCFVFSCVGIGVLQAAIVKYGRPSVIVFLVSSVMGLSALLMATFGGLDVWRQYEAGAYMGFHTPCGH